MIARHSPPKHAHVHACTQHIHILESSGSSRQLQVRSIKLPAGFYRGEGVRGRGEGESQRRAATEIKGAAWIGEGSPLQYAAQPHAISTQKENSCQVKIFSYSAPLSPLCQSQNIFLQYPPASRTAASRSAASRSADRPKLYDLSCPHPPASRTAASRSAASRSADRPKLYVLSCHHHPASRPTGSNFTF